jgi:hypothetical protein
MKGSLRCQVVISIRILGRRIFLWTAARSREGANLSFAFALTWSVLTTSSVSPYSPRLSDSQSYLHWHTFGIDLATTTSTMAQLEVYTEGTTVG